MPLDFVRTRLMTVFFPKRCPFCGRVMLPEERCCQDCAPLLPRIRPQEHCPRCGKRRCVCGAKPALTMTRSCFYYQGVAEYAVRQMKFHHHPGYARTLAHFMAERVAPEEREWDLLVPIPMTSSKRRRRGYNQAALLCQFLAGETGIAASLDALVKIRETKAQHTLTQEEREINLKDAYQAQPEQVAGKRILLCDDVLTTGSTLREAAKALCLAGAAEVGAVTLCCVERI